MRKLLLVALFAIAIMTVQSESNLAFGQDETVDQTDVTTLPSLTETADVKAVKAVFLLLCESDPQLMCVLDADGIWISNVRSAKIDFVIGLAKPQIECTMWSGPFKPTKPKVTSWDLLQVKSVTKDKFQTVVDSLQTDSAAVKKMITNSNL